MGVESAALMQSGGVKKHITGTPDASVLAIQSEYVFRNKHIRWCGGRVDCNLRSLLSESPDFLRRRKITGCRQWRAEQSSSVQNNTSQQLEGKAREEERESRSVCASICVRSLERQKLGARAGELEAGLTRVPLNRPLWLRAALAGLRA